MIQLSDQQLNTLVDYQILTSVLKKAFAESYTTPLRHHHQFKNPIAEKYSTLLLMPSWDNEKYLGVKLVTISPENSERQLPTIQGVYFLFDIKTGSPLMQCDARLLTVKRTAAASALASQYLSRRDSKSLLMVGTGYLAPHLIEAHASVRPIRKILVWGRDQKKATQLINFFKKEEIEIKTIGDLREGVEQADIITTATMSRLPLIKGDWLKPGQHLDLVGAYLPDHREVDDETILRSSVYVDTRKGASKEGGDIFMPLQSGVLKPEDIRSDLFEMCKNQTTFLRKRSKEITLFKSVGHALEDLATASFIFEKVKEA